MVISNKLAAVGIFVIIAICSYLMFEVVRMQTLIEAGASMSRRTEKFERLIDNKHQILILGDSLAYGVGVTKPEDSFAGLLAEHFDNTSIENNAEIGETIGSLEKTLEEKLPAHYEQIYIIVGGNDIMRMHINVFESKNSLKSVIRNSAQRADTVYLVTTGNFKDVSLTPWILKEVFNVRSNMIRSTALELENEIENFDYVDFQSELIESSKYKQLEAADGFHLNESGIRQLVSTTLRDTN